MRRRIILALVFTGAATYALATPGIRLLESTNGESEGMPLGFESWQETAAHYRHELERVELELETATEALEACQDDVSMATGEMWTPDH